AACLLAAYRPNIYIDFSGYQASIDSNGVLGCLQDLFNRRLNHKIIFGTDWPIFKLNSTYKNLVGRATEAMDNELDERESALVMAGTIRRLLDRRSGDAHLPKVEEACPKTRIEPSI